MQTGFRWSVKIPPAIKITRPINVAIAGLSILIAATLAHPWPFFLSVLFAILSGMLITAGANVINDICDLEIDRLNKPERVLPSGQMNIDTARRLTIILFVCGIIFSIFINFTAAVIATATSVLLIVYSIWLKRQPIIGNFVVSLSTALAFIFGALAAYQGIESRTEDGLPFGDWRVGIFPAVFSFLFHFGREVVKDIEDQAGDRSVNAKTLPLALGLRSAQVAASIAFILLAVVVFIPYRIRIYQELYWWCILIGVYPVVMYALIQVWKSPEPKNMRVVSALLKADMFIGLVAIYLGRYS